MEVDLSKLKVADLKKELKTRGLSVTGNKNELLERLQEAFATGGGSMEGVDGDEDEDFDEEDILGEEDDIEGDKLTPQEEEAALRGTLGVKRAKPVILPAKLTPSKKVTPKKMTIKRAEASPPAAVELATKNKVAITAPVITPVPKVVAVSNAEEPVTKKAKLDDTVVVAADARKLAMEARAARFGVPLVLPEEVKKATRAERFGTATNGEDSKSTKLSTDVGNMDVDKLKSRAERFGEVTAKVLTKTSEDEKKLQRLSKFGSSEQKSTEVVSPEIDDEIKKKRAAKFGVVA